MGESRGMREGPRGARIMLELAGTGEPIQGSIQAADPFDEKEEFFGWIQLIEAVEARRAAPGDDGYGPSGGEGR